MVKDHNNSNVSKDKEFKITLSIEDIDKIDEEIKNIEKNSKKSLEDSKIVEMNQMDIKRNQNTIKGVSLLNTCINCDDDFIPINSMINEKICKLCLEKQPLKDP
ncbi:MAG: hypothetical protein OEW78_00275 [Nitrosopumilus sp.]|uniref:hypothetical protein n=1 Tax=Nitrosopumilus sp. TaxID=2024843 RepID=UPI00246F305E|nr:hypothetical protein [Nitrosopumilus sp.]MDH5430305.1 hypothetical protein [Nitrosopumilus sp.]